MKNKFNFLILFGAALLFSSCATSSASQTEHPITYNIDLSKYTRTLDFHLDSDSNDFFCTIENIKLKKTTPETGDVLKIKCNAVLNIALQEITCVIYDDITDLGSIVLTNTASGKKFISETDFTFDEAVSDKLKLKLSFPSEGISKKPWIQFKEAKTLKKEFQGTETEQDTNNEDVSKINKQIENNEQSDLPAITEKKPQEIKKTDNNIQPQEVSDAWYISKIKNGKKVGKSISGPFTTKEQAILTWIIKDIASNNKYCISQNNQIVTSNPSSSFYYEYFNIQETLKKHGMEKTMDKYFHFIEIEEPEINKKVEKEMPEKTEQIIEEKKEEPPLIQAPIFDLSQLNKKDYSSTYEKEYLQDYAPKKEFTFPGSKNQDRKILNPDEADSLGCTLLMKAAKNGNNWEIKSLLESGANVNLKDKDGWTALMYAVRYQENISVVEALINAGAKIKITNNYNLSPLIIAATYNGNPEIIRKILNYYSVSEKEVLQAFVLLLSDNSSSDFSKLAKIEAFLEKSIPLNTFYKGKTPLMYAAQYSSSTSIIARLIEEGAVTTIRSTDGKTAFYYAQENKKLEHDEIFWSLNRK